MDTLVSVVVPNFNGAMYLSESLESIINQDYPNFEIIVVDVGSTDESVSIIESFSSSVTLLKQANLGSSAARNAGMLAAKGDYIALLDSDDIWNLVITSKSNNSKKSNKLSDKQYLTKLKEQNLALVSKIKDLNLKENLQDAINNNYLDKFYYDLKN